MEINDTVQLFGQGFDTLLCGSDWNICVTVVDEALNMFFQGAITLQNSHKSWLPEAP